MTFREAYLRTGRILNISVIPADRHSYVLHCRRKNLLIIFALPSPTKLLNYMTAPDTVIWSALLASSAVPGILNPVVLLQKLKDGSVVPWNWGSKFKDGSLRYMWSHWWFMTVLTQISVKGRYSSAGPESLL